MQISLPNKWTPRAYQLPAWKVMEQQKQRRGVMVWHRRAGKDLTAINFIGVAAHLRIGLYWHLLPTYNQGRKIVWNGFTKDGRRFLDHFPKELIAKQNDTDMRITFKNGSIYQVIGTDDCDKLVGTNPIGCVFSEYSLHDPKAWDMIRPILAENDGFSYFIYTPRGHNHGYRLWKMAKDNPKWFCSTLIAGSGEGCTKREDGTPVISDEAIQDELDAGMSQALIDQEFFCSFDSPIEGAYYGEILLKLEKEGRVRDVPWDPKLPVNTAWDLGMDDSTSIIFYQQVAQEIRIIDYYENFGEGLQHYAKELDKKDYVYGTHNVPHDAAVRELGTGKSRKEVARSLGMRWSVGKKRGVEDGIQAVRDCLYRCFIDKEKAARLVDALSQYRKEYDEEKKIFSSAPVHDWTSHGADAMRTLAWCFRDKPKNKKPPQDKAIEN